MKRLTIRNFGPIGETTIEVEQITLLVGPQSAGKSCILKTLCHCAWAEKLLMVTHDEKLFQENNYFFIQLLQYHHMQGYEKPDTQIVYKTTYLTLSYDHSSKTFACKFNGRYALQFRRPKLSYIPAERNVVSVLPDAMSLSMKNSNTQSFITDWNTARKIYTQRRLDVLDVHVAYQYDDQTKSDLIRLPDGTHITLANTSSGVQSLVPLLVHISCLTSGAFDSELSNSTTKIENKLCLERLYSRRVKRNDDLKVPLRFADNTYYFKTKEDAESFRQLAQNYTTYRFSDIYIEEPEANLWPQTQCHLLSKLVEIVDGIHCLTVSTHSPYLLSKFNNLILAGTVAPQSYAAYYIHDGAAESVVNADTQLIDAASLDAASFDIQEEFNRLLGYGD